MEQDRDDSNTRLFYWSNATPACYHIVARGLFCFMGSSQEIPTPSCVCVCACAWMCFRPVVTQLCVRVSKQKRCQQEQGGGLAGGSSRDKTTALARSLWVSVCVSQYHWPLSAEKQKVRMCAHATPLASLLTGRSVCVCVCVCVH